MAYVLEVSSPGLDHPLASLRQFKKNVGRKLRVRLKSGSQIEGNLQVVNEAAIVLAAESKEKKKKVVEEKEISFADIEKANVLVSFK